MATCVFLFVPLVCLHLYFPDVFMFLSHEFGDFYLRVHALKAFASADRNPFFPVSDINRKHESCETSV